MTVKELIAHLQGFDQDALIVAPTVDDYGDDNGLMKVETRDIEPRGKYVILFDQMPYTEEDIDEILA